MRAPYAYVLRRKVARDAGNYFVVNQAGVAELADAHDSIRVPFGSVGSILSAGSSVRSS